MAALLQRLPRPVRKVALVRASRIGDFLCATPAIRALAAALPEAEFTLIGLPFVYDLVARSRHLQRFIEFPGYPGMAEQFFEPQHALAFFAEMQSEEFDLVVQMHGSGVFSNPFALMLGGRVTVGFVRPGDGPGRLDDALAFPQTGHESERLVALARHLGAGDEGLATEFPLWAADHAAATALLAQARQPLIGLHPSARDAEKCWPLEHFAAAGRALREQVGGTLVIIAGKPDRDAAATVAEQAGGPCLNLAGRTSLGVTGAVISRLDVLVTNDSGPAHMAYALDTPAVTLFGNTDPARWGPPPGSVHRVLDGHGDIQAIPVPDVVAAGLAILGRA